MISLSLLNASFLELDVCFVGIPLDVGAGNRTGTRFGPRAIRCESSIIRSSNNDTGKKVL